MKQLKYSVDWKTKEGFIFLKAEELEDLWHLYHLISVGDNVKSTTLRRVSKESSTGSVQSEKVRLSITICVEKIDFDPGAEILRVSGPNVEENQHLKMGAYHSLDLELNRNVSISKLEWDRIALDRVKQACDPATFAEIAAVVMSEGLANVCLISKGMTIVRAKIEVNIPRKRRGAIDSHQKSLNNFYEAVLQAILRHIDFSVIKLVILASPGFVKEAFSKYMYAEAIRRELKIITENKGKFFECHSTSGHKHSLKEIFQDPVILAKLQDVHAAGEVRALADFYEMLKLDPDRATYGLKHIDFAVQSEAIQVLLLTDELFRASSVETRKKYVSIVDGVKDNGGEVYIFSGLHVSGEQLGQLGGIAAILRFPIQDLEDSDSDSDSD